MATTLMDVHPSLHLAGLLLWATAALGGESAAVGTFNSLAAEDSPYLRDLSPSRVVWHPWGPSAFAEAERLGRPIFVSIGYRSCLWTSRMDRDVFGDPGTAALLNAGCVNVKIDRFERPDLDRLCLRFVESTGQRAGWPLNLWMSHDRFPIRAAASVSQVDEGSGSFPLETAHMLELWSGEADHLRAQAGIELHSLAARTGPALAGPLELSESLVAPAESQILGQYDPVHGGFGRVPRFASPARLGFLAQRAGREPSGRTAEIREVIRSTLAHMARGGVRDHLGGGFFRYAMDEAWRRPYFEKLALDQALLTECYLVGYRLTREPEFAAVARETLGYALRELSHPEGGFYNGEHPESRPDPMGEPREGAFYVWHRDDLRRHAGGAAAVLEAVFDIQPGGNLPPGSDPFQALTGANVLYQARPPAEVARSLGLTLPEFEAQWSQGRASLLAARHQRPRPALDRLLITQMNAAFISAFCRASLQLNEPTYLDRARRTAKFIQAGLWDADTATLYRCRLDRAPRHLAVAEDHAFLVRALLDLHETTGESRWLHWAAEVQDAFDRHHADLAGGGYVDARHDCPDVPVALKSIDDAAGLSPNAVAAHNLVRWSVLLRDTVRARSTGRLLEAFAAPLRAGSGSVAGLFQAADAIVHPPGRILLIGPAQAPEVAAARARLASAPPGRWHVLSIEDNPARRWLDQRQALSPAAASHPLDRPAFFLTDGAGVEKGPFLLQELDNTLQIHRS